MPDINQKWIIKTENGQIRGPHTTAQVLKFIRDGIFQGTEQIAKYPDGQWFSISQEPEFYEKILESLEQSASQSSETDKQDLPETLVMTLPPNADRKVRDQQKVEELLRDEDLAKKTMENPPIRSTPTKAKSEGKAKVIRLGQAQQGPTLNLESVDTIKKKILFAKTKRPAFILFVVVILTLTFFIFSDSNFSSDKISLLIPQKGDPLSEVQIKERLAQSVQNIETDTFESLLEAQNKLVSLVEGASMNLEVRGLLCYVYKELWPYAKQDAHDVRAVAQLTQTTRALNVGSPYGSYCEAIKLYTSGRYREARGSIEAILDSTSDNFSLLPLVYQFKAEIMEGDKDLAMSIPYYEKASQIWETWNKPKISLGFAYLKSNNGNKAAESFRAVLARKKDYKLALLGLGMVEYRLFKKADSGEEFLTLGFAKSARIPKKIEAEAYLALAEINYEKGNKEKALKNAEKSYLLNPGSEAAKQLVLRLGGTDKISLSRNDKNEMLYLGDQFARAGDCFSAQAEYKAAFDLDPQNGIAAMKAARCLWQLNQTYEAIEWLKKATKAEPKLISAYVLQADYLSQRFDFVASAQALAEAIRIQANSFEVLRGMALLEFRKNNMLGALNYGFRAIKAYDADIDTYIILSKASRIYALSLTGTRDSEKRETTIRDMIRYATRAVEIDSTHPEAQITYAEMLAATSGIDAGVSYLKDLIKKYSFSHEYRVALGDLLRTEERYGDAKDIYEQVVTVDARNKKALLGLGISYRALGLNEKAIRMFLNAALADPTDAEPLFQAGKVYQETNRLQEALNQFQRVLKINPQFPRAYYNLGRTFFMMGNLDAAIEQVKKEKNQNPNIADSYILTAEILSAKKLYSECAAEYSAAIKLRPMGADIYVRAATCYRQSGLLDVAESMLTLAKAQENGYAEIYRELGAVFRLKGDIPAAVLSYKMYLELSPNASDKGEVLDVISRLGGSE